MLFLLIRQRVLLVNDFGYTSIGIRNICKYHLFLIVNPDCYSSNTRTPHLMSCISKSNEESLIYVLVSWVFHNVHFRLFSDLKMRFLFIRQRVFLSHDFGYNFVGIWSFCNDHLFLTLINAKKFFYNCLYIYMQNIQMIFPQYRLC